MKRFFLNQLFIAVLAVAAALTSCNKDDDGAGDKITAKVENASELSEVKTVKLVAWIVSSEENEEIASADFKNGGFTLNLPATLASKYLYPLAEDMPSTITLSNMNAKMAEVSIYGYNSAGDRIASFNCSKEDGNTEYGMYWLYTDSNVTISGTETDEYEEYDEVYISVFSLSLKKGWTAVYVTYTRTTQGGKTTYKSEYKNSPISGLKWYGYEW